MENKDPVVLMWPSPKKLSSDELDKIRKANKGRTLEIIATGSNADSWKEMS